MERVCAAQQSFDELVGKVAESGPVLWEQGAQSLLVLRPDQLNGLLQECNLLVALDEGSAPNMRLTVEVNGQSELTIPGGKEGNPIFVSLSTKQEESEAWLEILVRRFILTDGAQSQGSSLPLTLFALSAEEESESGFQENEPGPGFREDEPGPGIIKVKFGLPLEG